MATLCKKTNLLPRTTIAKKISKSRKPSSNTSLSKQLLHTLTELLKDSAQKLISKLIFKLRDRLHTTAASRQAKSLKGLSTLLPPNSSNPNTVIVLDDDDSQNHSSNPKTVILLDDDDTLNHSSNPKTAILLPPTCDSVVGAPSTLLPPNSLNQKTVVLDMDETLIHSTTIRKTSIRITPPVHYDFLVSFGVNGSIAYVTKRPFVDEFLQYLKQKNFEIVIFTAGSEAYASPLLDKLDPNGFISHRLYRRSCKVVNGRYYFKDLSNVGRNFVDVKFHVKDLSKIGRDLRNVVIVDDKPISYKLQPENGIPIKRFTDDLQDNELKKLMDSFFKSYDQYEDLKDALKHYRDLKVKI